MPIITLQIGNSDDKLTQARWADYVHSIADALQAGSAQIHFHGAPPNWTPWQNAAWVFQCDESRLGDLRDAVVAIRGRFDQESVAWTEGETQFL